MGLVVLEQRDDHAENHYASFKQSLLSLIDTARPNSKEVMHSVGLSLIMQDDHDDIQWEARHLRPHGKSIPKIGSKCIWFASLTGCMYSSLQISRGKLFTRHPRCPEYLHCSLLKSLVDLEGRAIISRMKYKVNAGNFPWKPPPTDM